MWFIVWSPALTEFTQIFASFWGTIASSSVGLLAHLSLSLAVGVLFVALVDAFGFFFDGRAMVACQVWAWLSELTSGENRVREFEKTIKSAEEAREGQPGLDIGIEDSEYASFQIWLSSQPGESVYRWEYFIANLYRYGHVFLFLSLGLWVLTGGFWGFRANFSLEWVVPAFVVLLASMGFYLLVSVAWLFHQAAFEQTQQALYQRFQESG